MQNLKERSAYGRLYKGVYCCAYKLVAGTETTRHTDFTLRWLQMLKDGGVQPVLVFDGKCTLMKIDVSPITERKDMKTKWKLSDLWMKEIIHKQLTQLKNQLLLVMIWGLLS